MRKNRILQYFRRVIIESNPNTEPLVIKAHPTQSNNLTEWRDSNNVVLSSISSAGAINSSSLVTPYASTYWVDATGGGDYSTIQEAINVVDAAAAIFVAASTFSLARYVINIAPGTYTENLTFANEKYLRVNMQGVRIVGTITIAQTECNGGVGSDNYPKVEFVGNSGNRPQKGDGAEITGVITCTRNNDSLSYLTFTGIEISNSLLFATSGTWVVNCNGVHFSNASTFISGDFSTGVNPCVLLETSNKTIIDAHIANVAGTATTVALYDCDNTEFDLINIDMDYGGILRNCTFTSDVTIASGTYEVDNFSYGEICRQTEDLSGATITYMDNYTGGDKVFNGASGAQLNTKSIAEELTIPVANGNTPAVATTGNLAPAGSLITGVVWRVTQAPGGGATTLDIGRTSGGNLDEFTDGASCDVLGETGTNLINGDTVHTGTQRNISADTLTVTTDADVTGSIMKIRIVVFYQDLTAPTT